MKYIIKLLAIAAICTCMSCRMEDKAPGMSGCGCVEVSIRTENNFSSKNAVKTSLGNNVENIFSGAVLGVYLHSTGQLLCTAKLDSPDEETVLSLPRSAYDIRMIGNLKLLDSSGTAHDIVLPESRSVLDSALYRLGGKSAAGSGLCGGDSGLRTETFEECRIYGIPRAGRADNVSITGPESLSIQMQSLFAKIKVNIDHSGVNRTASGGTDTGSFENRTLTVRNVNGAMKPFSTSSKAVCAEDIIPYGDFEPDIVNADYSSFTLYLPENDRGVLLPGNTDPAMKNMDELRNAAGDTEASLCTFLELGARVGVKCDMDNYGGYSGPVSYRLFPGADNCSDFSILRNNSYTINLGLTVNGIFQNGWKSAQNESFTDDRMFGFTRKDVLDTLFEESAIAEDEVVAVRKNRPGYCYVWFNSMKGFDILSNEGAGVVNWDHSPSSIGISGWTSDFLAPDRSYFDTPMYYELKKYGISPSYNPATRKLTFTVSEPEKFVSGKEFELTAWLIPGGESKKATLKLRTYDNIEVFERDGLNCVTNFYTGMKRTLQIRGLASESVSYSFSNGACISPVPSTTGSYMSGTAYEKTAEELADTRGKYSGIPLYGFATGGTTTISFKCSDEFNDDLRSMNLTVRKPLYSPPESSICWVPIDGTEVGFNAEGAWTDLLGNVLATETFDKENYETWLGLESVTPVAGTNSSYVWDENSRVYMKKITTATADMTVRPRNSILGTGSCTITFTPANPVFSSSFGSKTYDDLGSDPYFADMSYPTIVEKTATLSLKGNDFSRAELYWADMGGPYFHDTTGAWNFDSNSGRLSWSWGNRTMDAFRLFVPGNVPSGLRKVMVTFKNRHSGELYTISTYWADEFRAELGYYLVFKRNNPIAHIYVCTGKEYQELDNNVWGTRHDSSLFTLGTINDFPYGDYMSWNCGLSKVTATGNHLQVYAWDYVSPDFPNGASRWTRGTINDALERAEAGDFSFVSGIKFNDPVRMMIGQDYPMSTYVKIHVPDDSRLRMWGYRVVD